MQQSATRARATYHPEGWYPDPARDRDTFRWWTGQGWSRWLTADPQAPPPPDAHSVGLEVARPDPSARRPRHLRHLAMLLLVLAVLISAAVLVGWGRRDPVTLVNPAPTATFVPPVVGQELVGHTVLVNGEVRLDLDPQTSLTGPVALGGVGTDVVLAERRGGSGASAWRTYTLLGRTEEAMNDVALQDSARQLMAGMVHAMNDVSSTDPPVEYGPWVERDDLGPGGTAGELTGRVRGAFDEDLRVVVIDLDHRRRVVYGEVAKPTTSAEGRAALEQTRASLRRV